VFKYPIIGKLFEDPFEFWSKLLTGNVVLDTNVLRQYILRFVGDLTF
jgi:hypothetical protein